MASDIKEGCPSASASAHDLGHIKNNWIILKIHRQVPNITGGWIAKRKKECGMFGILRCIKNWKSCILISFIKGDFVCRL